MDGLGGFKEGLFDLDSAGGIIRLIVLLLAVAFFIYIAARMVLDKQAMVEALAAAVLGILASLLVQAIIRPDWLGFAAGLAAFVGVVALVYRVKFVKALALGIVAWVLYAVSGWLMGLLLEKA